MPFMEPYVTDKQDWLCVDYDGIDWIPDDCFHLDTVRRILAIPDDCQRLKTIRAELWPMIRDYVEQRYSIARLPNLDMTMPDMLSSVDFRLVRGYGVRLSASGYMDCTPWEVYTNKREALARARELERGED